MHNAVTAPDLIATLVFVQGGIAVTLLVGLAVKLAGPRVVTWIARQVCR